MARLLQMLFPLVAVASRYGSVVGFRATGTFQWAHHRPSSPVSCSRRRAAVDRGSGGKDGDVPSQASGQGEIPKQANGEVPVRKRRKRKSDFPSFAYTGRREYPGTTTEQKQQPFRVRFRSSGTTNNTAAANEDVFIFMNRRAVSVPKHGVDREDFLLSRALKAIFGPPLLSLGLFDNERLLPTSTQTRLLEGRAYARQEPFAAENITVPPSLDDLAARPRQLFEGFWFSSPARLLSFALSYYSFPYLTKFLDAFVTMEPQQLDEITSKFAPGISILYGTFISLTLSILYNRQREIQDNVALECSLLCTITRTLLSLFRDPGWKTFAVEAGQCAADQVRTLVRSSRGTELMLLMYSDPYARMLELVDSHEEELFRVNGSSGKSASRIVYARDVLKDLGKLRANRLSDESLALPPTHFQILNLLTGLILLGYTVSILPTVPPRSGAPGNESSLLFGALTSIYVLFYNFASDLNNPFRGVYQLRRSAGASHLLEIKWLIANHPFLRGQVDFEEVEEEPAGVQIRSPGLGDFWFERDEIYLDNEKENLD